MTAANKVTTGRFFLSLVYFAILAIVISGRWPQHFQILMNAAFVLFLIVAFGDMLDGYLARKYKEVTHFGRIADPFVDKILVCGSFIFFLQIDPLNGIFYAWFVVVVLAREFLVQGIRSVLEAEGIPFGATFWGKQKTLVQNSTVGTAICYTANFDPTSWPQYLTIGLMWLTLISTVVSGAVYVSSARKLFRSKKI